MEAHRLTRLLSPRSVAVVGAKQANEYRWLRCVSTFQGPVYSVNIDPHETAGIEALGVRNYQRLQDITFQCAAKAMAGCIAYQRFLADL